MSFTADAMIQAAEGYIGYNENDHGGKTKFGIWYGDRVHSSSYDGAAWCDMFLTYLAFQLGGEDGLDRAGEFAYTPHHAAWFARNGRWGSTPTRGSFGFVDWNCSKSISAIDHVVLVLGRDKQGRIVTIEGNTSDQVAKRYRDPRLFVGYGYPKYGKAVSVKTDKPATKPRANVKPATGDTAPKFPLPAGAWFSEGSHNGRANTKDRDGVRRAQARLKERGWSLAVDGIFGPETTQVTRAYQDEHGLKVDGAIGKITWASIWNAPIN